MSNGTEQKELAVRIETTKTMLQKFEKTFAEALPQTIPPKQFVRWSINAAMKVPKLMECSKMSFLGALMECAVKGLEPNGPSQEAVILPYWNKHKKCFEAQFQCMFKGLIKQAGRDGDISHVKPVLIHEKDEWEYQEGTDAYIRHRKFLDGDPGKVVAGYCMYYFKDQRPAAWYFMTEREIMQVKNSSKAKDDGPWQNWPDEMRKKTIIKRGFKNIPNAGEGVARSVSLDDQAEAGAEQHLDKEYADQFSGVVDIDEYEMADETPAGETSGDEALQQAAQAAKTRQQNQASQPDLSNEPDVPVA